MREVCGIASYCTAMVQKVGELILESLLGDPARSRLDKLFQPRGKFFLHSMMCCHLLEQIGKDGSSKQLFLPYCDM